MESCFGGGSVNFRSRLDACLQAIPRFNGVACGEERLNLSGVHGTQGYVLGNVCGGQEKEEIVAGIIVRDGCMTGVFYCIGDRYSPTVFAESRFLGDIGFVIGKLTEMLAKDTDVGNPDWVDRKFEKTSAALLDSKGCVVNPKTGNRLYQINPVIVDFGFGTAFAPLIMGARDGKFVFSVAEREGRLIKSCYEMTFSSAKEGNSFYRRVLDTQFISKKGNKVYRLGVNRFRHFRRVDGKFFAV